MSAHSDFIRSYCIETRYGPAGPPPDINMVLLNTGVWVADGQPLVGEVFGVELKPKGPWDDTSQAQRYDLEFKGTREDAHGMAWDMWQVVRDRMEKK